MQAVHGANFVDGNTARSVDIGCARTGAVDRPREMGVSAMLVCAYVTFSRHSLQCHGARGYLHAAVIDVEEPYSAIQCDFL